MPFPHYHQPDAFKNDGFLDYNKSITLDQKPQDV